MTAYAKVHTAAGEWERDGEDCEWTLELGNAYRFRVTVRDRDPWTGERLDELLVRVELPHQCDAWEITRHHDGGLEEADAWLNIFAGEVDDAKRALEHVPEPPT